MIRTSDIFIYLPDELLILIFFFVIFVRFLSLVYDVGSNTVVNEGSAIKEKFLENIPRIRTHLLILLISLFIINYIRFCLWNSYTTMTPPVTLLFDLLHVKNGAVYAFNMLLVSLYITFILITHKLDKSVFFQFEYFFILILILLLSLMIVKSTHLLVIYILFEGISLCLYIVVTSNRSDIKMTEAGLRYFILSSLSSMFFLFGICIVYNCFGTLDLIELPHRLAYNADGSLQATTTSIMGVYLIVFALFFKIGIAPFHVWVVEVYSGVHAVSFFFLSILSKYIYMILFYHLYMQFFFLFDEFICEVFLGVGVFSIAVGAFGPVLVREIKSILAYGSISHVGFMFLTLFDLNFWNNGSYLFYLIIYMFTSMSMFNLYLLLYFRHNHLKRFEDTSSLLYSSKFLGFVLLSLLLSMAGIPPFVGFFAKFFVLMSLFVTYVDSTFLVGFIMVLNALNFYIYTRIVVSLFYGPEKYTFVKFKDHILIAYFLMLTIMFNVFGFVYLGTHNQFLYQVYLHSIACYI